MRPCLIFLLSFLLLCHSRAVLATSWDEPWHEQVVKGADVFVLVKINSSDEQKGINATVLRTLGGESLTGTISITDFYQLDLCSRSGGHGPEFHLGRIDSCYFFLKKNAAGNYSMPTPTTGYAATSHGKVGATYRHSYHQALVPQAVYEPTMTAIFRRYHGQAYDAAFVNDYIARTLALPPAGLDEASGPTFFAQHVALETMFHLGLQSNYALLLPFLRETQNFHAQISAARALTGINTPEAKQALLALLGDKSSRDFAKVVAVWTLGTYQPTELKSQLVQLSRQASEKADGFRGNLMDPRVCTRIPTLKEALTKLTAQL